MNREIKFRVFVKKYSMIRDVIYFDNKIIKYWDHPSRNAAEIKGYTNICSIENNEIIQYTGLKDKNGKEVCEGDIIKTLYVNNDIFEVCFDKLSYIGKNKSYDLILGNVSSGDIQIIGNIYENPDLIK